MIAFDLFLDPERHEIIAHQARTIVALRRENARLRAAILAARQAVADAVAADPEQPLRVGREHILEAIEAVLSIELDEGGES